MIGELPTSLEIGGQYYSIRSDYRVILNIFQAFNDPELTDEDKCYVCLKCLYVDFEEIPKINMQEAADKAYWFVGGGNIAEEDKAQDIKTIDWEQDESLIFPAVNKVAGYETRAVRYLHWWAFLGLFNEIGEGLFAQVINIRTKKAKGKKLEKHEQEFYREHPNLINLKKRLTAEEQAENDFVNSLFY